MGQGYTEASLDYKSGEGLIITDRFWRNHFDADPNVLGKTFKMHTFDRVVRGVLPPDFRYLSSKAEIYDQLSHYRSKRLPDNRHAHDGQMIARLAPNRSIADAQAQLDALNAQQLSDDPIAQTIKDSDYHTTVASLHEDHVRTMKPVLLLVQGGVLCLLLVGAVNLAGLLLIRASGRTEEIAVRKALGASWWQVTSNTLVETIVLSLTGGALGMMLGAVGIRLTKVLGTELLPLGSQIAFDGRVAIASAIASVVLGICLALPIIWLNLRDKTGAHLQSETRGGTVSRHVQHLRHSFIVAQISIAVVLLCGAGLLAVCLKRTLEEPPGFESEQVLTAQLVLPFDSYPDTSSRLSFIRRLLDQLRPLPGVTHAAVSSGLPFTPDGSISKTIFPEGVDPRSGDSLRAHYYSAVTPDYERAMKIPLLQGRFIRDSDMAEPPRVAVIDETLARQHWPDGNAIGSRFSTTAYSEIDKKIFGPVGSSFVETSAFTVVGIVGNVKHTDLAETKHLGAIYVPLTHSIKLQVILRTAVNPASLAPTVQRLVRQLDPVLPMDNFRTMKSRIDDSLITRRSPAVLAVVFAAVALLLASTGIYGAVAYAVAQRRREIGVRLALGALRQQIGRQFLSIGLRLLVAGGVLGLIGAWAAGRVMQSILFEVPPVHSATLAITFIIMIVVTLLACLLPAMRASRIDPMEALRSE